jgi:hypothetical protein
VLRQCEPAGDRAGVDDGQRHCATGSHQVHSQDGDVKVVPANK